MYVCMYVCIVIHEQTVFLYLNSSMRQNLQDSSSQDQNPADFMSVGYLTPEPMTFSA